MPSSPGLLAPAARALCSPPPADRGRFIACVLIALLLVDRHRQGRQRRPSAARHQLVADPPRAATSRSAAWCSGSSSSLGRSAHAARCARRAARSAPSPTARCSRAGPGRCSTWSCSASPSGTRAPSPPPAQQSLVNDVAIYALLGLGLNVVVGFAGLLDLGYIAFYAIGAYTTAYFTSKTAIPWHAPVRLEPVLHLPDRGDRRGARRRPARRSDAAAARRLPGHRHARLRRDRPACSRTTRRASPTARAARSGCRSCRSTSGSFKYKWGLSSLPYYYLLLGIIVAGHAGVLGAEPQPHRAARWPPSARTRSPPKRWACRRCATSCIAFAIGASVVGLRRRHLRDGAVLRPVVVQLPGVDPGADRRHLRRHGLGVRRRARRGRAAGPALQPARTPCRPNDRYIYFGAVIMLMMVFRPQGLLPSRRRSREIALSEAGLGHADATMSGSAS